MSVGFADIYQRELHKIRLIGSRNKPQKFTQRAKSKSQCEQLPRCLFSIEKFINNKQESVMMATAVELFALKKKVLYINIRFFSF